MIVSYGETAYKATLFIPTIKAVLSRETIMGIFQDSEIEAISTQDEIMASYDTHEIEAIVAAEIVATLSQTTYIATKGE